MSDLLRRRRRNDADLVLSRFVISSNEGKYMRTSTTLNAVDAVLRAVQNGGALVVLTVLRLITGSSLVFGICLVILLALSTQSGRVSRRQPHCRCQNR